MSRPHTAFSRRLPMLLRGLALALGPGALLTLASQSALAQTAPPPDAQAAVLQRVEITGSSIKRIDGETALPVQVIRKEEIDKLAVTTAAELLTKISANAAALTDGASFSDIAGQRGFNGANLRGIGVSSTLVLLNGRRIANFASPGSSSGVDLNSIPSAAIDRVEVLKDGASAIYGTDAIGGVINFITRKDYRGADLSVYAARTQDGGADKTIATISGGIGDLAKDRFNVFGVLDYQDSTELRSTQRDWIGSVWQPDINLDVGSSNTFPANVRRTRPNGSPTGGRYNPSAPNCNPPATIYAPTSFVGPNACLYDYMHNTEIFPASKRFGFIGRGQFALTPEHLLFAELLYSNTKTRYRISPLTITNLNYPADGPYYPTSLGLSGPLRMNLRLQEAGGRTNEVDSTTQRLLLGAQGTVFGWDYDTAFNHSTNHAVDAYVDGYVATTAFNAAFLTGRINPFGSSDAAGSALLASTKINDRARDSSATTNAWDLKLSRPLFALGGGDAQLALGLEARRESMDFKPSALLQAGEIRGDGAATPFNASRNVRALFAEMSLPFSKALEGQVALRIDDYSDAGNTTNPKFGLRFQAAPQLVFRGSFSGGFRAPSLTDLYQPSRIGQTNGIYDDPLGCVNNGTIDNTQNPDYCGIQPDKWTGGNPDLKPEKSKQISLGMVFEPSKMVSATVDVWHIEKKDVITSPEGVFFADPVRFAQYLIRDSADPALAGIPGPITAVDSRLQNFAALKTSGVDLGIELRLPDTAIGRFGVNLSGTYIFDFKSQAGAGSNYTDGVGLFSNDQVIQRWRHLLSFNYDYGPFGATLSQTFYRGHRDQQPLQDGSYRRVSDYALWDLTASYQLGKNLKLRAGVKNLFDTHPPVSNQVYFFLAGYDPSYTDPRGRTFFASLSYRFK